MSRTGGALPASLLLILLLGGLGGLALHTARLQRAAGAKALHHAGAQTAAAAGLERAEAAWDPIAAGRLGVGAAHGLPLAPAAGGSISHDTLLRLGAGLFLLRSAGEYRAPDGLLLARAGLARLIRLETPAVPDTAAALVGAGLQVTADSGVQGEDIVPPGWDSVCPPAGPPALAAGLPPGVSAGLACPGPVCISGAPPAGVDSSLPTSLFTGLGLSPATLTAHADLSVSATVGLAPAATSGTCDRTQPNNWGDPASPGGPCGDYFPLVATGPGTQLVSGSGQGLLVAGGDLVLRGTVRFHGVVLAMGNVTLQDAAEVYGTVLVQGNLQVADSARLRRSSCAVQRASTGAARPHRTIPRGSWRWPG